MKTPFVPFDEFDQDNLFPHKSSQAVLAEIPEYKNFVKNVVGGIGVIVDDTDPANPIVNFDVTSIPEYALEEATDEVLGGIKLGAGLTYNPATEQVDVQFPTATPLQVFEFVNVAAFPAIGTASTIYVSKTTDKTYRWDTNVAAYKRLDEEIGGEGGASPSVFEFASLAAFPGTGAAATIYIALDSGYSYRWTGAIYILLFESTITEVTQTTVRNETGSTIAKGALIGYSGATSSGYPTVVPFVANGSANEINFFGLMGSTLATANNGYCISYGPLDNIDTRGNVASTIAVGDETWTAGEILYAHPTVAGKLTKIKPEHAISVAIIVTLHASTGRLFVSIDRGVSHLDELHDVALSGRVNTSVLMWNSLLSKYVHTVLPSNESIGGEVITYVPTNFSTISEALTYAKNLPLIGNGSCRIEVLNGHIESTQFNISNADFSRVSVHAQGTVTFDTTSWVVFYLMSGYFYGSNNVTPRFTGTFDFTGTGAGKTLINCKTSKIRIGSEAATTYITNASSAFYAYGSTFEVTKLTAVIASYGAILRNSYGTLIECQFNERILTDGGKVTLFGGSYGNSATAGIAIEATMGAKVTIQGGSINGTVRAYTGSIINGNITYLSHPTSGTITEFFDIQTASSLNIDIQNVYLRASSSINLLNIDKASSALISRKAGEGYASIGNSTGKLSIQSNSSNVSLYGLGSMNFSGGYSQTKNTITVGGLLLAP